MTKAPHIGIFVSLIAVACHTQTPEATRSKALSIPTHFLPKFTEPTTNIATTQGILLGKKLFFDPILSSNGKVSCATCHMPAKAFSDGQPVSTGGVSGNPLHRNSPALFNIAWATGFFWDGGAKNIESLAFAPLHHPDEMNKKANLSARDINQIPEYRAMFKQAFGVDTASEVEIVRALAQYQRSLISAQSKYDKWIQNPTLYPLTDLELKGLEIVNQKCAACHAPHYFTDFDYHNNGIDSVFNDTRFESVFLGRYRITLNPADVGKYKTPSLRNLAFTAPYMHDGRFNTLAEVLEHYSSGIKPSSTLSHKLPVGGFQLTEYEKKAIEEFLLTLNDYPFISAQNP